jgi:hypothetical protein
MRSLPTSLAAMVVVAASTPAFALNPQPLPPGRAVVQTHATEPPDPCAAFKTKKAHAGCMAGRRVHHPAMAIGSQSSGAGAGK